MRYTFCAIFWPLLFAVRVLMILLGFFIVPIAMIWRKEVKSDRVPTWTSWSLVRLPTWAWPWGNIRDGSKGDVRGKYWFEQAPQWMWGWLKEYNWLAWRNPCNNFSRWTPILSVDINGIETKCLSQSIKHQFLSAGFPYYHWRWNFWKDCWLKCGHKLDLKYNGKDWSSDLQKATRGFTFRIDRG